MTPVICLRVKNKTALDFETLSIYSSPGRKIMKSIILAAAVISGLLFSATEASALVCASGPHRAGQGRRDRQSRRLPPLKPVKRAA